MYRDFIYLDTDRIQSIIAQLNRGILEKVIEGRVQDLQGKAGLAAGVLSSFLPIEFGGSVSKAHSTQSSKVLHDYAFNVALQSLQENDLYVEAEDWDRETVPIPDGAFIEVRGSLSILDYALLKNLADNESTLDRIFSSESLSSAPPNSGARKRNKRSIKQMWAFVEAVMGNSLQIRVARSETLVFSGPLTRDYLRENTRDLIFKYGGNPREGWSMLAQVSQVTAPDNKLAAFKRLTESLPGPPSDGEDFGSVSDVLNPVVGFLNAFQEIMASVSYPDIAVTPIAVYREPGSLR